MNSASEKPGYSWEPFLGIECPVCGDNLQVLTIITGGQDGDLIQCESCNRDGVLLVNGESKTIIWN